MEATVYDCRFLWAIELRDPEEEGFRYAKLDDSGDEVDWTDDLPSLLPFSMAEEALGDPDDEDDDDEDDDRKERGSRASSSSSLPSRHVEDPFGLPHFKTHEVRDDPVGAWVHHAWEATEHVVDEFAEEFEEFGEDTARVFEPRGKMNSFGDGGHHSPTDDVKRRKRRPWNEIDVANKEDGWYVAARRGGKAGRVGGGGSGDADEHASEKYLMIHKHGPCPYHRKTFAPMYMPGGSACDGA